MKQTTEESDERSAGRSDYKRPNLVEFGRVGALTQSGTTGVMTENEVANGMMCQMIATYQMC